MLLEAKLCSCGEITQVHILDINGACRIICPACGKSSGKAFSVEEATILWNSTYSAVELLPMLRAYESALIALEVGNTTIARATFARFKHEVYSLLSNQITTG